MKKFYYLWLLALFTCWQLQAQVFIWEDFNAMPSSSITAEWTTSYGFQPNTIDACDVQAEKATISTFFGQPFRILESPILAAASDGTDITVTFDFKAISTDVGTTQLQFSVNPNDASPSFTDVGTPITAANYVSSSSCTNFSFTIPGASVPSGSDVQFRVVCTRGTVNVIYVIDNFHAYQSLTCSPVSGIQVDDVTANTVDFSWTAGADMEGSWEYVVQPAGTGEPTTADGTVTTAMASASGLSAATEYEIYVRGNCGDATTPDYSFWIGPIAFYTECDPYTVTYTQNFDNTTPPAIDVCWSTMIDGSTSTSSSIVSYTTTSLPQLIHSAPNSIKFSNSNDTAGDYFLISPQFSDMGTDKRIKAFVYFDHPGENDSLKVGIMTDPTDATTFNLIDTFAEADLGADTWVEIISSFESYTGTGQYVALVYKPGGTYNGFYVDDFVYENIPSCVQPADIILDAMTDTSVQISWTEQNMASNWEYVLQPAGTGNPDGGTIVPTTTNPLSITTGIDPNTEYEFYVRTVCTAGSDISSWTGPFTFRTPCASFTADYSNNFDDLANQTVDPCWSILIDGAASTSPYIRSDQYKSFSPSMSMKFYNASDLDGEYFLISPQFTDIDGTTRVRFRALKTDNELLDQYIVGTMSDPADATTFTEVATIANADILENDWGQAQYIVDLPASTTDQYVAIKWIPGGSYNSLYIDDFYYETIPTCLEVSDIEATEISDTGFILSWTASDSNETTWEYVFRDVTAENPVVPTAPTMDGTSTTDNPATVTGLLPDTSYEIWVRSVCDTAAPDKGVWMGPVYITTKCAPEMVTYVQDFTDYTYSGPPTCWAEADGGNVTDGFNAYANSDWSYDGFMNDGSTGAARMYYTQTDKAEWLISPVIDLTAEGSYQLTFDLGVTEGFSSTTGYNFQGDDSLQVVISTDYGTTWEVLQTYDATTTLTDGLSMEVIDLSSYAGNNIQIGYLGTTGTAVDASYNVFIDNFVVEPFLTAEVLTIADSPAQTCEMVEMITQGELVGITDTTPGAEDASFTVDIGISTTDDDPSTWADSVWMAATYNAASADDATKDEYTLTVDASTLAAGTYYVAARWQVNTDPYVYAAQGGLWDGSANTNAELIIEDVAAITATADMTTICDGETVALSATSDDTSFTYEWDNGAGSGVDVSVMPATTTTYTVTGTNDSGCTQTATVTVIVNATPDAPTADESQEFCSADMPTVADLVATGDNIAWYDAVTDGNMLAATTALVDGTTYYAESVSAEGCPSLLRTAVTVIVGQAAGSAGEDGVLTICSSATAVDLMSSLGGTPDMGGTWTPALASGGSIFNPAVDAAGVYTYTIFGTTPCAEVSATVTVTVNAAPTAPVADALQEFCTTDGATVADLTATGDNITWYDAATTGNMLSATEVLVDGMAYYAQSENAEGCASASRTVVVVNLDENLCPSNNTNCEDAEELIINDTATPGNTFNTSDDMFTDCGSMTDGVWYTVTGDGADLTATVSPSGWDAEIAILEGDCTTGFTCVDGADDAGVDGVESVTFESVAGTTYYILVGSNESLSEGIFSIQLTTNMGIGDIVNLDSSITLYPNPVVNVLNINSEKEVIMAQIFALDGSLISESTSIENNAINVHSLQSGNYILRVILEDHSVVTEKFIKQ